MAKLIWLMGPSGAGKDTLLTHLREQEPTHLLVAHRYITRPADAGFENHVALSPAEFERREKRGLFCLSWRANDRAYGIGIELNHWLAAGFDVVVNGSRQHLTDAQTRYGEALIPVCLTVSPRTLRQRLEARGREDPREIDQRLARAARYSSPGPHCLYLSNDGSVMECAAALLALIPAASTSPFNLENNHV